jgi:ribose/xylose/arabinose/galactoside ABC-type transport system permease subunit
MLIVILTGGIDLSVGPIVALTGIIVAGLYKSGMPLPLAILICLFVGAAVGAVNGFFIARFKLQSFIVTLATLGAIRGLVYVYSDVPITPTDTAYRAVLGAGTIGPFPVSALIMLACYPIVSFFLNRTRSGTGDRVAIGGNASPCAWLLSMSALIFAWLTSFPGFSLPWPGDPGRPPGNIPAGVGSGFELDAIAACVIGGAILGGWSVAAPGYPGWGRRLAMIDNRLNLFNVQSYYQQILKGVIILVAVLACRKQL